MRKKILNWVLGFFGLLGFAMVFGGVIGAYGDYRKGVIVAVVGLGLMILTFAGNYLCTRFSYRPRPLPMDKEWEKLKKAL